MLSTIKHKTTILQPTYWLLTLSLALLVGLFATATIVHGAALAQSATPTGVVTGAIINVRSGAGTGYDRIAQLSQGAQIEIKGRNAAGDWLRVCCVANGQEGWVLGALLQLQFPAGQDVNSLPVVESAASAPSAPSAAPAANLVPQNNYAKAEGTNPLTGLGLPAGRGNQRPLIVCVNNEYASRPQFGLSQADVVYEYLMEGYGVTRMSAIFYGEEAALIGPVRSARIINQSLSTLYNGLTACSGASDAVRYMMKFQSPAPYIDFDLDDPSATRYVVSVGHDYRTRMRTSSAMLRRWLADKGIEQPANLRGFTFGGLGRSGAAANSITIPYPRGVSVFYQYDAGSGRYLRWIAGGAHIDANNGAQLGAENVVIQFVTHEATNIVEDSLGSRSIGLHLIGSGRAIVMRDGQAFEGSWRSDAGGDTPHFYDAAGNEIPLKPGKTWISIVPPTYTISYQ